MKRYLHTLTCLAAAVLVLLLSACTADDAQQDGDNAEGHPVAVAFSASVPAFTTRGEVTTTTDLQTQGFGVFAYHTGGSTWAEAGAATTPNFMYNQLVSWSAVSPSTGSWTYSPVKYWPNANQPADDATATASEARSHLTFFAYAPHNGRGLNPSGNTIAGPPTIDYTWAATNDLLYADPQRIDCYKTMAEGYATVTGRVPFTFKHALAKVVFKVRRKEATGSDITLTGLTVSSDGATSGTFSLGSNEWTSTTGSGADPLAFTGSLSVTDHSDGHTIGSPTLMMPGTVTFTYTIGYTVSTTTYAHADIDMTPMVLEKNKQYTIVFVIDGDNVESYVLREREAEQW